MLVVVALLPVMSVAVGMSDVVLAGVLFLLLFGFKKLPDAARSIGKSARVFKSEVSEMKEEDRQRESKKKGDVSSTTAADTTADDAKPRTDNESGPVA